MHAGTQELLGWPQRVQLFIDGRLRTTPFRVASKHRPNISSPHMPANTQHLIDGLVSAMCDVDAAQCLPDILKCLVGHLRSAWGRWEQVRLFLETREVERCRAQAAPREVRQAQYSYGAHAALQDVLLAWYVLDGLLKHKAEQSAADATRNAPLARCREEFQKLLPSLITSYMPQFSSSCVAAKSMYVIDAVEEYKHRFYDLMRSWYIPGAVTSSDCLRRCEEHVRQRLRVLREESLLSLPVAKQQQRDTVSKVSPVAQPVALLTPVVADTVPNLGTTSQLRPTGKALVDIFIQEVFEIMKNKYCCHHCGAAYQSDATRMEHMKVHYATHEQRDTNPAVRLRFASLEDFLQHEPLGGSESEVQYFPKFFCKTSDAHRPNFSATVSVRKGSSISGAAGDRKRPRAVGGVVVTDVAEVYRCSVCSTVVPPTQDPVSREWVLKNCKYINHAAGVSGGIMHEGCA